MIRFPLGRATERVANDILQIADGIKKRGPIEVGPPITGAVIVDRLNAPAMPSQMDTASAGGAIEASAVTPSEPSTPSNNLERGVATGKDMVDML